MTEWHLIDSAPRDGRFLVYGGTWVCEHSDWDRDFSIEPMFMVTRKDGGPFLIADTEYYKPVVENPTHWMRPEPPKV
jgi:hypothetical protein